ncbi:MAG: Stf0 family sulfotransferase [Cyanobacteria bacterium J06597_16]
MSSTVSTISQSNSSLMKKPLANSSLGDKPLANSYMVCSTVRSGSTLLCKTLAQLKGCGQPTEYFHRHTIQRLSLYNNPEKFLSYCEDIFQQSLINNGTFGLKMHWRQLEDFFTLARQVPQLKTYSDKAILDAIFPGLTFVYLRREDVVAQAVSAAIATQTGRWEKPAKGEHSCKTSAPDKPVKFQPWHIYEWDQAFKEQNQHWQQFFTDNQLTPHAVVYETLVASFSQEINSVLDYLNLSTEANIETLSLPTKRQASPANQSFSQAYSRMPTPLLAAIHAVYRQLKPFPKESA